jgi:hypothetical protein
MLNYQNISFGSSDNSSWGIGPSARYYFDVQGIKPFLGLGYSFAQQKSYLEKNLAKIFTHDQWKKLSKDLGFESKAQPGELTHFHWMGLFQAFMSPLVSDQKRKIILG